MMDVMERDAAIFPIRELHYENFYYRCICGGKVYAHAQIQIDGSVAMIHLYMQRWGSRVLAEMRNDFEFIKTLLKAKGVWRLVGTHTIVGADKWVKFLRLLGFRLVFNSCLPDGVPCAMALMEI